MRRRFIKAGVPECTTDYHASSRAVRRMRLYLQPRRNTSIRRRDHIGQAVVEEVSRASIPVGRNQNHSTA